MLSSEMILLSVVELHKLRERLKESTNLQERLKELNPKNVFLNLQTCNPICSHLIFLIFLDDFDYCIFEWR